MQYSGFFNGDQEYGQDEFSRYFNNIYESGVSVDDTGTMTLAVAKSASSVTVGAGFAIIKGFYLYNDSELGISINADTDYSRIDRVVIRLNLLTGPAEITIKEGIAGSMPAPPALQRDDNIYELSLARVMVSPSGDISVLDERFDTSVCGAIRPKNMTEYKDMVSEYERRWEEWFAAQQGKGWRDIYIQPTEPREAVAGSIWIQTLDQ